MLASMPWLQFNQLSLMNANKGAFGVNLEYWDLVRLRGDTGKLKADCQRSYAIRRLQHRRCK
jgi:hypothetical protein